MEITELTVHELMDKLGKKETTISEITKSYLSRIEEKEKDEFLDYLGNCLNPLLHPLAGTFT